MKISKKFEVEITFQELVVIASVILTLILH